MGDKFSLSGLISPLQYRLSRLTIYWGSAMRTVAPILTVGAAILFLLSVSGVAQAQNEQLLRGISEFDLVIEIVDDEDRRECGLSEDVYRNAVAFPLASSPISVNTSASPYIYVNVVAMAVHSGAAIQGCIASYDIEVRVFRSLSESGRSIRVTVVAWRDGGILSGPPGSFSNHVSDTLERIAKNFVVDWRGNQ